MTRHINDHVPMGASVAISGEHIRQIEAAIIEALAPVRDIASALAAKESETPAAAVLSSEQFSELKALLQPGFELSSLMLADYKAHQAKAEAEQAKEVASAKEAMERSKSGENSQD